MTYLTLRACDEVREMLPKFEKILAGYGIKITDNWENEATQTIEIITDAVGYPNIRSVSAVAYDCFEGDIKSFKFTGKQSALPARYNEHLH